MTGQHLHEFDLELTRYALDNVSAQMGDPDFAAYVEEELSAPVLTYLKALDDDPEPRPLVLNCEELDELAMVFMYGPPEFDRAWIVSEALHRRSINCMAEIRDALAREYAQEWARLSTQFAEQLEGRRVWLHHGVEIVGQWVHEVRRLLRAMGATALLPRPEGTFPTPGHPQPAPPPPPEALAVPNSPRNEDTLASAIAEIRDLLVSQRTAREWYTTEEAGKVLGRAEFTVREWCRHGRVHAEKKGSGRGKYQGWVISHAELLRIQHEGLLPVKR